MYKKILAVLLMSICLIGCSTNTQSIPEKELIGINKSELEVTTPQAPTPEVTQFLEMFPGAQKEYDNKFPEYVYTGEDEILEVISEYTAKTFGQDREDTDINVPSPYIIETKEINDEETLENFTEVYGVFSMYGFKITDTRMDMTYASIVPGKITLKRNENGNFKVADAEFVRDGSLYTEDVERIFAGFDDVYEKFSSYKNIDELRKRLHEYVRDFEFDISTFNLGDGDYIIHINEDLVVDMTPASAYTAIISVDRNYEGQDTGLLVQKIDFVSSENDELIKKYNLNKEEMFEYDIFPLSAEEQMIVNSDIPYYHYNYDETIGFTGTTTTVKDIIGPIYANVYMDGDNITLIEQIYTP